MTYTPGYVVVGHLSKDLPVGGGETGGGTVLYAGVTAAQLGVPTALVTACAAADRGLLAPAEAAGVLCAVQPSPVTTTFSMEYHGRRANCICMPAPRPSAPLPCLRRGRARRFCTSARWPTKWTRRRPGIRCAPTR